MSSTKVAAPPCRRQRTRAGRARRPRDAHGSHGRPIRGVDADVFRPSRPPSHSTSRPRDVGTSLTPLARPVHALSPTVAVVQPECCRSVFCDRSRRRHDSRQLALPPSAAHTRAPRLRGCLGATAPRHQSAECRVPEQCMPPVYADTACPRAAFPVVGHATALFSTDRPLGRAHSRKGRRRCSGGSLAPPAPMGPEYAGSKKIPRLYTPRADDVVEKVQSISVCDRCDQPLAAYISCQPSCRRRPACAQTANGWRPAL